MISAKKKNYMTNFLFVEIEIKLEEIVLKILKVNLQNNILNLTHVFEINKFEERFINLCPYITLCQNVVILVFSKNCISK